MSDAPLGELNVRTARERRLGATIARETGFSYAVVRGRLPRAHGRTLLRTLFGDVWSKRGSEPEATVTERPSRPMSPRTAVKEQARSVGPHTIHRVRQEFSTSCGVAIVAMLARVAHADAMSVLFPVQRAPFSTWLKDLKRDLDHFGVTYAPRWRRCRSWEEIPSTSLVKVKWQANGRTGFQWVIFQRRDNGEWRVIDPDPPRQGTLRLSNGELSKFEGVTYLVVNARRPE